jgi:phenylpyruvate tautomerase PptA (4-oxalocrotonate tautomerase family)
VSRYPIIGGASTSRTRVVLADDDVLLREGPAGSVKAPPSVVSVGYARQQGLSHRALKNTAGIIIVKELTELVAAAARDASLRERTRVLLTESLEGGWGSAGTNTDAHSWSSRTTEGSASGARYG